MTTKKSTYVTCDICSTSQRVPHVAHGQTNGKSNAGRGKTCLRVVSSKSNIQLGLSGKVTHINPIYTGSLTSFFVYKISHITEEFVKHSILYLAEPNMWKSLSLLHQPGLGLPLVSMDDQDGTISINATRTLQLTAARFTARKAIGTATFLHLEVLLFTTLDVIFPQ